MHKQTSTSTTHQTQYTPSIFPYGISVLGTKWETALHVGALAHCHYHTLIDKWNPMPLTCNHPRPPSISAHTHSMHKMCNVIGFSISLVSFSIFMIEHITLRCRRHRRYPKPNTTSSTSKNHSRNVRPHKCDAASHLCILFCNIWPESNKGILAAAAALYGCPPQSACNFPSHSSAHRTSHLPSGCKMGCIVRIL